MQIMWAMLSECHREQQFSQCHDDLDGRKNEGNRGKGRILDEHSERCFLFRSVVKFLAKVDESIYIQPFELFVQNVYGPNRVL